MWKTNKNALTLITSICPPTWLASFETFSCDLVTPSRYIAIFAALVETWFTVKSITTFCKKKSSFLNGTFYIMQILFSFRNLQIHVWRSYFNFWSAKSKISYTPNWHMLPYTPSSHPWRQEPCSWWHGVPFLQLLQVNPHSNPNVILSHTF